jgi:hypothetical protein
VIEQESRDVHAVLAHGEVQRLPVLIVRARQRRIFGDERLHGMEITRGGGLKERPHIGAAPGRPHELLIGFQLGWPQHAVFRLDGFDVVYQRRPTVEAVLLRQRVLCLGQLYRRIGGAQRVEMFFGLCGAVRATDVPADDGGGTDMTISFRISPVSIVGLKEDRKL